MNVHLQQIVQYLEYFRRSVFRMCAFQQREEQSWIVLVTVTAVSLSFTEFLASYLNVAAAQLFSTYPSTNGHSFFIACIKTLGLLFCRLVAL